MDTINFRSLLDTEYSYRRNENPSYSLRAFARDLKIVPSQLSEVLKGKTGLSTKKARTIAENLGMNEKEINVFVAMVEAEHGRSPQIVERAKKYLQEAAHAENFKNLSLDGFKFISEWIYFAILSTMELDNYDGTIDFIATKLNEDKSSVEEAIKTLLKLDLIDLKDSKFVITGEMYTTTHDIQSSAIKKCHKQHLRKSIEALDTVDVNDRDISTMTMAIDKSKLPEAKRRIKEFRRSLCKYLEEGEKNEVYNINIQFIPLTQQEEK